VQIGPDGTRTVLVDNCSVLQLGNFWFGLGFLALGFERFTGFGEVLLP
jgi:hypothetical protein